MQPDLEAQISTAGIANGDRILIALSGGVDSVVLLHLLHACAERCGLQLHAFHLDHQIRPDSQADADFVRQLCAKLAIPCVVEVCAVPALAAAAKLSLEMAGRKARRQFLLRQAGRIEARLIALAHHQDDQAETFMLRLLRGTGVAGLAGMKIIQDPWWRPLLGCSREKILAYARQQQLTWVEDETNADSVYLRNRLRHQLLPQLQAINPQFAERVAELCRQVQDDEDYWRQQVAGLLPLLIVSQTDGLRLQRQALLNLPAAVRMRVMRETLHRVRGGLQRLEAVHLRSIDKLLFADRSQAQLDLPGCWVARRYDSLWVRSEPPERPPVYDLELPVPGEVRLPCGRIMLARLQSQPTGEAAHIAEFSRAELDAPLRIRSWQAGDRFEPLGMDGRKLLKRLFGDEKIELEERSRTPVLVSGKRILWVVGLRRSRHAPVDAKTDNILHLKLL